MVARAKKSIVVDEFGEQFDLPDKVQANQYDVVNQWSQSDQWQFANTRSGNANDDPTTRSRITAAARFEYLNNSYCNGVVRKLAQEVIGTGPRLEIIQKSSTKSSSDAANELEKIWADWAEETNFVESMHMSVIEEIVAGEVFHQFVSDRTLQTVPVKIQQIEGIQISSAGYQPDFFFNQNRPRVDGLELDDLGNVLGFYKLKQNPGSDFVGMDMGIGKPDLIPADIMVQMFRRERPTSYRGVSHLTPCLDSFGQLRRYTEATIETAENSAGIMATIQTTMPADQGCDPGPAGTLVRQYGAATLVTLPYGWQSNAFKPEQPTTGYTDFVNAKLHEVISCLLIPYNQAAGDSSDFNFASGQLDHRLFYRYVSWQRQRQDERLLNRFFDFWFEMAILAGKVPSSLGVFDFKWYWPPQSPIDPAKAANAAKTLKEAGLLDEQRYWQETYSINAKDAVDKQLRLEAYKVTQREAVEAELGISLQPTPAPAPADPAAQPEPTNGRPK